MPGRNFENRLFCLTLAQSPEVFRDFLLFPIFQVFFLGRNFKTILRPLKFTLLYPDRPHFFAKNISEFLRAEPSERPGTGRATR